MTKPITISKKQLVSDLIKLRALLIIQTTITFGYFLTVMIDFSFITNLKSHDNIALVHFILSTIVKLIFIWYIWKTYPVNRKSKIDNTWMIAILGVIGMWIWMPNKKKIEKITNGNVN